MQQTFQTTVHQQGAALIIQLPFDPDTVWGQKECHYVHGAVNEHRIRTLIQMRSNGYIISLGAAWQRDTGVHDGDAVRVSIEPEGPQLTTMAEDIVVAIQAEPAAVAFFNSLATFYRKNYVN